jgi:hypothetical protein
MAGTAQPPPPPPPPPVEFETVITKVPLAKPQLLEIEMLMVYVPVVVGVPEITPVVDANESHDGKPVATKVVGLLLPVIV